MQKYKNNFQDDAGNAIVGASVYVYDVGTTNAATIYEDDETTTKSNPLTTDSNGQYMFKANDGDYDIKHVKSGVDTVWFYDVQFLDRAGVKNSLAALTGTQFDFIQDATPTATASGEWWLKTDSGGVYLSSAAGTGNWDLQYTHVLLTNSGYLLNQGDRINGGNYSYQDQSLLGLLPFQYLKGDGSSAYVQVSDNDSFDVGTQDFGFDIYCIPPTAGTDECLFSKRTTGAGYYAQYNADGTFQLGFDDSSGVLTLDTTTVLNPNVVNGISVDCDRSGNATVHINGVKDTTEVDISSDLLTLSNAIDLYFMRTAAGADYYNGSLILVRFWNRTRTTAELERYSHSSLMAIDPADEGGSNVAQNVSSCVNSSYTAFSGASATGFTFESDGVGVQRCGTADEIECIAGKKVQVYFDLSGAGVAPFYNLKRSIGGTLIANAQTSSIGGNFFSFTPTETTTAVLEFTSTDGNAFSGSVSNLNINAEGCTARYKPQDIIDGFWKDSSGNDNNGAITGGEIVNKSEQLVEESGTWTASVLLGGASTGIVIGAQECTYKKIGSVVHAFAYIVFDKGGTSTGSLSIAGLPYTAKNNTLIDYQCTVRAERIGAAGEITLAEVDDNTTTINFFQKPLSTAAGSNTDDTDIVATGTDAIIEINVTYETEE